MGALGIGDVVVLIALDTDDPKWPSFGAEGGCSLNDADA